MFYLSDWFVYTAFIYNSLISLTLLSPEHTVWSWFQQMEEGVWPKPGKSKRYPPALPSWAIHSSSSSTTDPSTFFSYLLFPGAVEDDDQTEGWLAGKWDGGRCNCPWANPSKPMVVTGASQGPEASSYVSKTNSLSIASPVIACPSAFCRLPKKKARFSGRLSYLCWK